MKDCFMLSVEIWPLQRTAESKLHIPWNLVIWFHDFSGAGAECK